MISPNYVTRSGMSNAVGPASSNRLWVGPLLLILVIALIYIFSLMPNGPTPHRFQSRFQHDDVDEFEFHHRRLEEMARAEEDDASKEQLLLSGMVCLNGGVYNETADACVCVHNFSGNRCEKGMSKICFNNGYYSQEMKRCSCPMPWTGPNCQHRCSGALGRVNRTTLRCQCSNQQMFGPNCDQVCINGEVIDDVCQCLPGYYGRSCATCDPSYTTSGECDVNNKRRGAVNSRLTLSGLSFCMITIGLLCVTARRRRQAMVPPMDDTWYRVFQTHPRHRCRHEFTCGSAWLPRDRAMFVTTGRASVSHSGRRSNGSRGNRRMTTPPPSYTSVDNITDDESPPTYEEALRTLDEERTDMMATSRSEEGKDEATPVEEEIPIVSASAENEENEPRNGGNSSATTPQ